MPGTRPRLRAGRLAGGPPQIETVHRPGNTSDSEAFGEAVKTVRERRSSTSAKSASTFALEITDTSFTYHRDTDRINAEETSPKSNAISVL